MVLLRQLQQRLGRKPHRMGLVLGGNIGARRTYRSNRFLAGLLQQIYGFRSHNGLLAGSRLSHTEPRT